MRALSRTWVISGKTLRDEKEAFSLDFLGNTDFENTFYFGKDYKKIETPLDEIEKKNGTIILLF